MAGIAAIAALVAATLLPAGVADAAALPGDPFSPPVALSGGTSPSVAVGLFGNAAIAWAGNSGGIFFAERPPGGGVFTAPVELADDPYAQAPVVVENGLGAAAVAWVDRPRSDAPDPPDPDAIRVVVRLPDGSFGAPQTAPQPEPIGPPQPNTLGRQTYVDSPAAAIDPSGVVALAWRDGDASTVNRTIAVLREPDGSFGPELVDRRGRSAPVLAVARGTFLLVWSGPHADDDPQPPRYVYEAERPPGAAAFGAPAVISDPAEDASNGSSDPTIVADAAGDALVTWNGVVPGAMLASNVDVAFRPAGSSGFLAPQRVGSGLRPTAALDARGDAVIVWASYQSEAVVFRPAGGAFGPLELDPVTDGGSTEQDPVDLDAFGTTVLLRRINDETPDVYLGASLRPAGGVFGRTAAVTPPGTVTKFPSMATDAFGNGTVVWATPQIGGGDIIEYADYSASAPLVADAVLRGTSLRYRLSEPARVSIVVEHGRRVEGRLVTRGTADAVNRVTLDPALLRRHGRYRVLLRARDQGPHASRTAVVRVRR